MDSDGGWRKTLFYDTEAETWRQGDWYGLRFLALQEKRYANYAPQSEKLWIPQIQRWPQIYERALVLASGLLPERSQGGLVYSAVSGKLAQTLADKLSVTLERSHA
ncbi:MAG: hypothetical protein IGQ88_13805 [Gloeomargaritaceae cyanobacterium C42_A2020_066]|nr:hypothetical protein [Gloeomargaritaceae cyanobacterium C42_A2020_066]